MAKQNNKIKKYRKPLNLNIGMLIFAALLVYIIYCVVMYFQTSHIVRYEVKEGSLATNNTYTGVVIRDETIVPTQSTGYINFYAYEGERVAAYNLVYTLDETGRLNEYLEEASLGENSLTEKELAAFRSEIVSFAHSYDALDYEQTYGFKHSLKNTVMKLTNNNLLQKINEMSGAGGSGGVEFCYAPLTGIVAHWTDGYETLTPEQVTEEIFSDKNYEKKQILGDALVEAGEAAYKLSTNENWSLVIPIDAERGAELLEEEYVKVKFLKNQLESWASVKLLNNGDGNTYLQLSFTNSMITFVSDRFLEVELIIHDETGLKIPNSSIVQKEFYLIPEAFVTVGGVSSDSTIIRQCYLEDGTISSETVRASVYSFNDETKEYYVDASVLNAGDILYKLNSQDTYTVSKRATLIGVYNMNKGYADFKQINIMYQNDEYSIVKANTKYGLNVYDYIVLNAESVHDDQFINE